MRDKAFLFLSIAVLLAIVGLPTAELSTQAKIQYEKLPDGVERWYRVQAPAEKPWFFQQLENIFDVILPRPDKLPFGKSVAFLAGVSDYQYLTPDLPFVKNDLLDMREFLLNKGGFDEVYVASEKIVERYLIEDYIRNKFSNWLKSEDRLLFYFSGHGADAGGKTGYMQFSGAKSNNFAGPQILPINDITDWCDESHIRHLFFILDCCASGLAFTHKGNEENSLQQTLATLSRNGSRIIFTAGTADEQTFEVTRPGGKGNGVFTRALLNALDQGVTDKGKDGFLTAEEIFARAKDEVTGFASRYKKNLTPRWWQYDEGTYRGTFIFINPEAKIQGIPLADRYAENIAATARGQRVAEVGIIELTSFVAGEVYIDGQPEGRIASGDMMRYNRSVGNHKVEIKTSSQVLTANVQVIKGQIQPITIGTPTTPTQSSPVKPTPVRPKFRSTPEELSSDQVIKMLQDKKFYDSSKNESGPGFDNQFELQTIAGDKVVIDHASGLMWQQGGSENSMTFEAAEKWIRDLNNRGYAGFQDWRLPALEETMSLMEREKLNGDLYINPKFDPKQRWIWTCDPVTGALRAAWVVNFPYGRCYNGYWDTGSHVRAVRPGQSSF